MEFWGWIEPSHIPRKDAAVRWYGSGYFCIFCPMAAGWTDCGSGWVLTWSTSWSHLTWPINSFFFLDKKLFLFFFSLEIRKPMWARERQRYTEGGAASCSGREPESSRRLTLTRYAIDLLVWVHSKSLTLELNSWRLHLEKQMWIRSSPITSYSLPSPPSPPSLKK